MIRYPLAATNGDLTLNADDRDKVRSRIRLLLDCAKGDRPMLLEFGSSLQQFMPDDGTATLEAELLKLDLERWCVDEASVEFDVAPVRSNQTGRIQLQVSFDV